MIHEVNQHGKDVFLMWSDHRCKTEQIIKYNEKTDVNVGDFLASGVAENRVYYEIIDVIEKRPSTLSGFTYVTAKSIRKTTIQDEK